ncbi:MAG TPA: zinc ribbon domain-containing protein, partial [Burkholderiales bacterium]|nr:zinc ribbon domain-containing protein [Burkholderiales bacterium]
MTAEKPLPLPDAISQGFWDAASRHVLVIQRCGHCGTLAHPPRVVCANCLAPVPSWTFQPVSGRGRIRTWTVMRQSFLPGFKADVPYVIVEAELEEQKGLRVLAR